MMGNQGLLERKGLAQGLELGSPIGSPPRRPGQGPALCRGRLQAADSPLSE
jgi:hypothetical protein